MILNIKVKILSTIFFSLLLIFVSNSITGIKKPLIQLTEKEKQWIKKHPAIRVANEIDWPPFDYVEDGKPKGMAIDYINLLAKKVGIRLYFVNGYSWAELIELFKQKKIDLMPVFYINNARKSFTLYTAPYHRAKLGVFTYNGNKKWNGSLYHKKVGIETAHGAIPFIKKIYPKIKLIEIDSKVELVRQLATKKLDAIIGNPLVFYHHSRESQIENIQLIDFIKMSKEQQRKTSLPYRSKKGLAHTSWDFKQRHETNIRKRTGSN